MNKRLAILLPALLAATPALAHTGHADGAGLVTGLLHPFAGLDHLLAMVAVGLWAARIGGRGRWLLPAVFVAVMTAGVGLALAGLSVPWTEPGIAASVLLLGLAVAFAAHAPPGAAAGAVAVFALWHGAAHGYEVPVAATPALYAAGVALATAVLHGCGVGVGVGLRLRSAWLRAAGGVIAAAGAAQLLIA